MSILDLKTGYFSIENPFRILDRWRNGYCYRKIVEINRRQMEMRWSRRAQHELLRRQHPLIVELQLYFSCVVKKRVLFHEHTEFNSVRVNDRLAVAFRPIASAVCDPVAFASSYPAGEDLSPGPAAQMVPAVAAIDFRAGRWQGCFRYGDASGSR